MAGLNQIIELLESLPATSRGIGISLHMAPLKASPAGSATDAVSRRKSHGVVKPVVVEVLKAHAPHFMHADEVVAEVRARGVPLSEKDPKATVVTAMLRLAREAEIKRLAEGVERIEGNRFRWYTTYEATQARRAASEQPQPSELSRSAVRESA